VNCSYRFVLEIRGPSGASVYNGALDPDWEPALQGTRLAGLRRMNVWHDEGDGCLIEPLWDVESGPPKTHALRVHMRDGDREWSAEFSTNEYFAESARAVVAAQLVAGEVAADDQVRYAVSAYEVGSGTSDRTCATTGESRLSVVDRPQPLTVRDRHFSTLVARSAAQGEGNTADVEVVLPKTVLDQVCELTDAAGERETGGILIGHLCRDEIRDDVGVEVTAQIPARHTVAEPEKLTFTSETWTDVRSAVALRNQGELLVGWWHSHPAFSWCAKCPIDRQRTCRFATGFLSADDKALHRSIFPAAFTQALVATKSAAGLDHRMFGWRNGVLRPRGFRVS
jgi:proteasome lid subunit RPN8/RPN11